jgi:hypothetical protein
MLKSYAAIYKKDHLEWLDDVPEQDNVQVIVTFVEPPIQKPTAQTLRILEQAWGCVENPQSLAACDDDIAQMRDEWA